MKAIWQKPRWRIWSRPQESRKARFRDLDDCARFVHSNTVDMRSRISHYPCRIHVEDLERGDEYIAREVAVTEGQIHHWERWLLFRSAQFVHNMALDRVMQLKDRHTHPLEILDMVTATYEFIGRMADRKIISGSLAFSFEFQDVGGQQLTWPTDFTQNIDGVSPDAWSEVEAFSVDRLVPASDLAENRRKLALDTSIEIYSHFRWTDPPRRSLEIAQEERFGPPRRF
jgi:myo-inositol catabolism protein IolC